MGNKITNFKGKYAFLSNFYPHAPVYLDGILYPTAEHAYQAYKTKDLEERKTIAGAQGARIAKRMGRAATMRDGWEDVKQNHMFRVVSVKFCSCRILIEKLVQTDGIKLVEDNSWGDTYWGMCNGIGENRLGVILMEVREYLIKMNSRQEGDK